MKYRKALLIAVAIIGIWLFRADFAHLRSTSVFGQATVKPQMKTLFSDERIFRVNTGSRKILALTIDDGPDVRFTPQVLDILQKYNIKATFFVVGKTAAAHPELVKRAAEQGNEIGNHTYTHPDLTKVSTTQTQQEIMQTEDVIESITGEKPHYFRPPKGFSSTDNLDIAIAKGYKVIMWSVCVEHDSSPTIDNMAQRVIDAAKPGIIILCHDGRLDRSRTMQALPLIIEGYQKKGYRFVLLNELLDSRVENNKQKL